MVLKVLFDGSFNGDLCINMNHHQNAIFPQLDNFIKHSHSFAMTIFHKSAAHTLSNVKYIGFDMQEAYPAFKYMCTNSSIAVAPKNVIDEHGAFLNKASLPLSLKLLILWLPQMLSLDRYLVFSFAYIKFG
jgi:hypothetical protein